MKLALAHCSGVEPGLCRLMVQSVNTNGKREVADSSWFPSPAVAKTACPEASRTVTARSPIPVPGKNSGSAFLMTEGRSVFLKKVSSRIRPAMPTTCDASSVIGLKMIRYSGLRSSTRSACDGATPPR